MGVRNEQADSFFIDSDRHGYGWARIFVQGGIGSEGNRWAYICAIFHFGNYSYLWTHMGMPHQRGKQGGGK